MDQYLGKNIQDHDKLAMKVNDISEKIEKKKSQYQTMKQKVERLNDLNNKLSSGYELSLRMVVDVSKLLTNYTKMFDDLEQLIGNLDDDMNIKQNDIQYISNLTKESIKKISYDFNSQFSTVVKALEKNNSSESIQYANKLKTIVNQLPSDARNINGMPQNGGSSKRASVRKSKLK